MTELTLRLQEGDTETTIAVDQDIFTIGRLPECNLYLPLLEYPATMLAW